MLREEDSAREEHGDLKACRHLLSIRARLRNATICRILETPCTDRASSPGISSSLDSADLNSETLSSSLRETKETAIQVRAHEEEGYFTRPAMSQTEIAQDQHATAFKCSSEGEDRARQVDDVCHGLVLHGGYSPKLAVKKLLLLDDEDPQQGCRSASEAALGLSRRLAGAASLRRKEVMMIMERLYRDHPGAVWRVPPFLQTPSLH